MSCTERRTSRCCAGAIAALAAAPVRAAPETAPPAHPGGFDTGTLASIGFGLVAVVAAILILAWLARQVPMLRRSSGPIAILGGLNYKNLDADQDLLKKELNETGKDLSQNELTKELAEARAAIASLPCTLRIGDDMNASIGVPSLASSTARIRICQSFLRAAASG